MLGGAPIVFLQALDNATRSITNHHQVKQVIQPSSHMEEVRRGWKLPWGDNVVAIPEEDNALNHAQPAN